MGGFFLVILIGYFLELVIKKRRWYRNFIGKISGYGKCPNCGDSWEWKQPMKQLSGASKVQICRDCVANFRDLDIKEIVKNLKKENWTDEELIEVEYSLEEYKENQSVQLN